MSKTKKDAPSFRRDFREKERRPEKRGGQYNVLRWAEEEREEGSLEEGNDDGREASDGLDEDQRG